MVTINRDEDGNVRSIYHYKDNSALYHREDGPAVIAYYDSWGTIALEAYYVNGQSHREDGPAQIRYYPDGSIQSVGYCLCDIYYAINRPAIVHYFPNGKKEVECYYQSGKLHRENGPAMIWYTESGEIWEKNYFLHGEEIIDEFQILVIEGLREDA